MTYRLPPLNSLRAFEAAARLLSFKKAADELAVTPTAVSHQIKLLEEFLDLRLFRRLTRALELTTEGAAMLPRVQEGFASLAAAIEATRRKETGGIVTVCAPPSFAARWLVPRLGGFSRAHPDIDLRLSSSVATVDSRDKTSAAEGNSATAPEHDLMIRFDAAITLAARSTGCSLRPTSLSAIRRSLPANTRYANRVTFSGIP